MRFVCALFRNQMFEILKFRFYVRYVDYIYASFEIDSDINIFYVITYFDSCIQLTFQVDANNCFFFLDAFVIRNDECFQTTLSQTYAVNLSPHRYFYHPPNLKFTALKLFSGLQLFFKLLTFSVGKLISLKLLLLIVFILLTLLIPFVKNRRIPPILKGI